VLVYYVLVYYVLVYYVLVYYFVDHCLSFVLFIFGIVCPSIYCSLHSFSIFKLVLLLLDKYRPMTDGM